MFFNNFSKLKDLVVVSEKIIENRFVQKIRRTAVCDTCRCQIKSYENPRQVIKMYGNFKIVANAVTSVNRHFPNSRVKQSAIVPAYKVQLLNFGIGIVDKSNNIYTPEGCLLKGDKLDFFGKPVHRQ